MPQKQKSQILRFGVFEANLSARELRKHGTRVRLRGQPFCILAMLLARPGDVITREEMQQKLWPADTFVDFAHSLNSAIKKLRAALGDSPENSRYIETIPRVGYRFIAPVQEVLLGQPPAHEIDRSRLEGRARPRARRTGLLVAGSVGLLVVLFAATFSWRRFAPHSSPAPETMSLAVLPFANLTGDSAQEYFSDGLTEEMISQLGQVNPGRLRVIARTSVMPFKGSSEPLTQIGGELGVQYVLEGSVRRDSGRVLITAQLVRVKDQSRIWSREYDRELAGLLTLQQEVAQEVADEMQVTLSGEPRTVAAAPKSAPSPNSYEAYDLYLQGRYFWNKRTKEGFQRAADCFEQAIARDPNYARAYAGLADTYELMSSWFVTPHRESMPKARAAALKALELDESLAEAHASLALIAENYDYDWQTAEKEFKRAIQLDPSYATAHQWFAECLSWQGRFAEALAESERARQLDPLSLIIATDHGAILYFSRQYDRAIEQFRAVESMDPNFPRWRMIELADVEKGNFRQALSDVEGWHHNDGSTAWEAQAFILARAGKLDQARRAMEKWEVWYRTHSAPLTANVLMAYVALGRNDDAIALMEKAYAEHSQAIIELKVAPYYDPLRADPRFQDLLRRIGLADNLHVSQPHSTSYDFRGSSHSGRQHVSYRACAASSCKSSLKVFTKRLASDSEKSNGGRSLMTLW